jgi:antitoxin component of RelBE/YafQ-DinJ toxin-antitoxin module
VRIENKVDSIVSNEWVFGKDFMINKLDARDIIHNIQTYFSFIDMTTATDTSIQFSINSSIRDGAFSVFDHMGITPHDAMEGFLIWVQQTHAVPLAVSGPYIKKDSEYENWLNGSLKNTLTLLDAGIMQSYPHDEAMDILDQKIGALKSSLTIQ